jgi:hypothetical protein
MTRNHIFWELLNSFHQSTYGADTYICPKDVDDDVGMVGNCVFVGANNFSPLKDIIIKNRVRFPNRIHHG